MSVTTREIPLEDEYKKNTGITSQDVKRLRDWLKTQPHLPGRYITDLDLILTYHCCERSTEVSKQVLDLHFTLRTLFTGVFKDRVFDSKMEKALSACLFKALPTRATDGSVILFIRIINSDVKEFIMLDWVRAFYMVTDVWQYEEGTWPGFILLVDMNGMTSSHVTRIDLQILQQLLYFLQEAMLVKLKGLHFINAPGFMDKLLMMFKPFMKKTLLDVLMVHQVGSQTIDKYIPTECMPKESGGEYKTLKECKEEVIAKMRASEEYFSMEKKKRVEEKLRPGKPKSISDIFGGIEGSFKKLDID